jgi:hypothetical protein
LGGSNDHLLYGSEQQATIGKVKELRGHSNAAEIDAGESGGQD